VPAEKRCGDLIDTEPTEDVEDQGELRLLRQLRLAAREDHSEDIVLDRFRGEEGLDHGRYRPFAQHVAVQLRSERARGALAAQNVEGAVLGRHHEPGLRIRWHSAVAPHLHGTTKRLLGNVLRQGQVVRAEYPSQGRHQTAPLVPEQVLADFH